MNFAWKNRPDLKRLRLVAVTFLLIAIAAAINPVNACECDEILTPPCALFSRADAVFVGTLSSGNSSNTQGYPVKTALFRIDESFKGGLGAEAEVEFPFPDCIVPLNVGEKYLVYARRASANFGQTQFISQNCDGTKHLTNAARDLSYLRGRSNRESLGSISGRIMGIRDRELDGIEVRSQGFGRTLTSAVDALGFFRFDTPKPGEFQIQVSIPLWLDVLSQPGLDASSEAAKTIIHYTVILKGEECDYREIRVTRKYSAGISGTVVDTNGQPVRRLSIQLYPVAEKPDFRYLGGLIEGTDLAGNFSFKSVKEGRYFLGVNLGEVPNFSTPYPKTFFPGVSSAEEATIISVDENQELSIGTFKLRPKLVERIVRGFLVWSDGTPVIKRATGSSTPGRRNLYLLDPEKLIGISSFRRVGPNTIQIEEDGRFSFIGYEGYTYVIHVDALNSNGELMHARHVKISIGKESPVLRLTLSLPGTGQSQDIMREELKERP